jgi:demethylmenaquinone methyltransferase / 2-methoxy-6-polyprenyl-1,4-benzoquinol methylase
MIDTRIYIQRLLEAEPLRKPVLRSIVQSLQLPPGSRGLDAGCGIGLQTLLLTQAAGGDGHITGVDILPELLAYGAATMAALGLSDRITFREADVNHLPFDAGAFDWVWSVDCIGYPAGELMPLLEESKRVVKPGGEIFLLGWSSQQLLPGYPLLEARLNATCSGYIPFLKDKCPEKNFSRAMQWLRKAGLEGIKAQTFVADIQSPIEGEEWIALVSLFNMLWGDPQPDALPGDWEAYQRLCTPGSAEFILDIPDYYGFFTYTMFRGRVPKRN